ncbi:hypothetical protein C8N40_10191 [Pontibacter mucosus]|uniref:Uncharacterized protein n=1 Tax=Pontibacter mucosus TaxID=1649266 RepID=A0A2T5YSH6_9BACT|nr:hypothetical protein [Pontibacter mucosus]PTX22269.1 hypothetical protein C8N40_10191 [Pontibacter mucosus]
MNPIVRNILAVIAGVVIGSAVNMALITVSGSVIPPPEGADVTTTEGLRASMHLFQPKHFIFPFLAHALGTLAGAFVAAAVAASYKMRFAFGIGIYFLAGGIASVFLLPSPTWYTVVDLIGAYLPMAYVAGKLAGRKAKPVPQESMA